MDLCVPDLFYFYDEIEIFFSMTSKKIDWSVHGEEIKRLYVDDRLSVRELIDRITVERGVSYHAGTVTNFLGREGLLRSKVEAHALAISKARRICELCEKEHAPKNFNQRWCDDCTGGGKDKKRVRLHGLPSTLFEKMFQEQEHACKICGKKFESYLNTRKKKTLFVDHDHVTGQVRGLLCPRCNNGMSYVDDEDWADAAARYVNEAKSSTIRIVVKPPRTRRYVRNKSVSERPRNAQDTLELSSGGVFQAQQLHY